MLNKKPLLLILFLTLSLRAFSAIFTVTSNADSGPGTLRDALTQAAANGSATKDYIYFNLPDTSQTGRTITILTDLPQLSSNLVIDGSTQPGGNFGVSGAKVKIEAAIGPTYNIRHCLDITGEENIEIYSLFLDVPTSLALSNYNNVIGIYGISPQNITIGAPGKGNIIKNIGGAIVLDNNVPDTTRPISVNIKISSNILGLNEDGQTECILQAGGLNVTRAYDLTLGGSTPAEGNVFGGQVNYDEDYYYPIHTGHLIIQNNFFGTNYTATQPVYNNNTGNSLGISAFTLDSLAISNNVFAGRSDIGIDNIACFFSITGNKFGTDITGTNVLGIPVFSMVIGYCTGGGIIGGSTIADQNVFSGAYNTPGRSGIGGVVINIGSPGVEVVGNSFRCNFSPRAYEYDPVGPIPNFITIDSRTTTNISGRATPTSRVDLYYSLSCDHCEPEKQFASTNADNNGNWSYSGQLSGENIIAASTFQHTTTEFTRTSIGTDSVQITNACPGGTGSITGTIPVNVTSLQWVDSTGKIVGTNANLTNVKPGKYKLKVKSFGCGDSTSYFEIKTKFFLDTSGIKRTEPSCGNPTGSISGLNIINNDPGAPYLIWQDAGGKPLAYSIDLSNVPAGDYYLQVKSADSTCSEKFGPFTLQNVAGPNMDQSKAAIQSTNCGQSTGSITGITATGSGTLKYIWWNSQQQTVGTTADLLNQPAGTYKLEVTDDSQCGPVYTSDLTIPETNGIALDESGAQTAAASCNVNNGSVTGIKVTGATQYQWTDSSNKTVGTALDLQNVPAGTYTLTASNSFGCIATSKPYTVAPLPPTKFPVYPSNIITACYQSSNGSITVNTDALVKSARWVNAQGAPAGTGSALANIPAGSYQLYLTDQNGCENYYNTYTVTQYAILAATDIGTVTNDQCTLGTGSISGENITGGASPYTYAWYDANNQQIGSGASLSNLQAGNYSLKVSDSGCGSLTLNYQVTDQTEDVPPPSVSNVALCSSGSAIIRINDPSVSTLYRLYVNNTDTQPVAEQKGGFFTVKVTGNSTYYVSQLNGSCESSRTQVAVTVGLSALNIANTFTPNGDGVNDLWQIKGIVNYPQSEVQVFTRWGERVFYSKGYVTPFDGTFNGKPLPAGVYYYIINLNTNCSLLTGSLTIIR